MDKELGKLDREYTKVQVELETRTNNFQKVVDSLQETIENVRKDQDSVIAKLRQDVLEQKHELDDERQLNDEKIADFDKIIGGKNE